MFLCVVASPSTDKICATWEYPRQIFNSVHSNDLVSIGVWGHDYLGGKTFLPEKFWSPKVEKQKKKRKKAQNLVQMLWYTEK